MNRAYSVLQIKAVQDDERIITGIATTPSVDRMGDIIEPLGVQFKNPLSLLHQHDSTCPVGTVTFDQPTKDGITFTAKLPNIADPGPLKDRVDTAWGEVKAGLVRAVSIGFRPIEYSFIDNGGIRFTDIEVFELSLVSVPAQADAVISTIKSIDAPLLAATGKQQKASDRPKPPGVTGTPQVKTKPATAAAARDVPASNKTPVTVRNTKLAKKSIAEQISAFQDTRKAKALRMDEIMDEAGDKGETLDAAGKEEYDGLEAEVKEIDEHLGRLEVRQKSAVATARPVVGSNADEGTNVRTVSASAVKSAEKVAPGIRFARLARIKGLAKIEQRDALGLAEQLYGQRDPVIVDVVKAAVSGGATVSGNWATNLVGTETSVFADFAEFLRPQTILGKFGQGGIPSLRKVPFRTALIGQDSGGAGYWVGEGKGKPLTAFDFTRTSLAPLKVANIAVATMELLRDSSPSAEAILRDQIAAALRARLDTDFIDPAKAASSGVSPASITHGVSAIHSTGNTADDVRADFRALMATFIAANNAPQNAVWIANSTTALSLALMVNALGQPEFPGITMRGGTFLGIPVIVSEYVPTVSAGAYVVLANASDIYEADDGEVAVDMSTEASLEMLDAPTANSTTPTAASVVSMFQTNSVAFRAERTINWAPRRASAVAVLDHVNWGAGS